MAVKVFRHSLRGDPPASSSPLNVAVSTAGDVGHVHYFYAFTRLFAPSSKRDVLMIALV